MTGETFSGFSDLAGHRISDDPRVEQACNTLDELSCTDLSSLLTITSHVRSKSATMHDLIEGNRFHVPATVNQRDLHWVEGVIMKSSEDIDFVELSPLQPFGINSVLAGTNQKNVVSALRRSEVNADATTALFRVALNKFLESPDKEDIRVASNTRTVRAQTFDPGTKFLPHFKVFGEVTVGTQSSDYGLREVEALVRHLGTEVDIMEKLAVSEKSEIKDTKISIGNLVFFHDLAEQGRINTEDARRNTANSSYSLVQANVLDIPEYMPLDSPTLEKDLKDFGLKRGLKILAKLRAALQEQRPDLFARTNLHLGRIAGTGYYRHVCYKMTATNYNELTIPIADGGTTDWATKCTSNKQLFSVSSGIGTELVAQHLIS